MPKKTKTEEISEENKRTNEVALFDFGDSYLLCAQRLMESPPAHLRFDAPIYFLLLQALELDRCRRRSDETCREYLVDCWTGRSAGFAPLRIIGHPASGTQPL